MDDATFHAEWSRVIEEARAFERLVLKKMREARLEGSTIIEARRRLDEEAITTKMTELHVDRRTACLALAKDALMRARAAMEDGQ
jgi:hypothetical protein